MIVPREEPGRFDVAAHYDDLDRFYREIWGEHVHHGLWTTGRESPEVAVRQLIDLVADLARIKPGDSVCDVGCGYGGTARLLALERGAIVTALTVSQAQHSYAQSLNPDADNPQYLLRDWLENGLPADQFDVVLAIESSEHMASLTTCFEEVLRVLKPGGRFVVCAWLTRESPRSWEIQHLLEPICREGRLAQMGSAREYQRLIRESGLELTEIRDVSRQVGRTWRICLGRALKGFCSRRDYRRFVLSRDNPNRVFALTMARIWLAYAIGSMRYGILTAIKPP